MSQYPRSAVLISRFHLLVGAVLVVGPGQVRPLHATPVRFDQQVGHQLRVPVLGVDSIMESPPGGHLTDTTGGEAKSRLRKI